MHSLTILVRSSSAYAGEYRKILSYHEIPPSPMAKDELFVSGNRHRLRSRTSYSIMAARCFAKRFSGDTRGLSTNDQKKKINAGASIASL